MKKWLVVVLAAAFFAGCDTDPPPNGIIIIDEPPPFTGLTSIAEVIEYLADPEQDGSDPDNPVQLAVKINMNEWEQLRDAIVDADKFVALDLTRCYNIPQVFNFYANDQIVSVVLPSEATYIQHSMFYGSKNLRQVTLPASLTKLGAAAFYDCTDLKLVIFRVPTPPAMISLLPAIPEGSEKLFYNTSPNLAIKVPAESVAAYKAAWPMWADKIGPM